MFRRKRVISLLILFILSFSWVTFGRAQKIIEDFYLSNYKGKQIREWEVSGEKAVSFDEHVDINKVNAKYFQDNNTIDVKADKARLSKKNMNIRLQDNVKIKDQQGLQLQTRVLDWCQNDKTVVSDQEVKVAKGDKIKLKAKGLKADTDLKKLNFAEEVKLKLIDKDSVVTVNCDGPLEILYDEQKAIFHNNVVIDAPEGKIIAHQAVAFFDSENKMIEKIVATGDVKIIRDDVVTFGEKAIYSEKNKKITLKGKPRLVIFPDKEGENSLFKGSNKNEDSGS